MLACVSCSRTAEGLTDRQSRAKRDGNSGTKNFWITGNYGDAVANIRSRVLSRPYIYKRSFRAVTEVAFPRFPR